MNIKVSDKWLREYLHTNASSQEIARLLSLCGPAVESLEKVGQDYVYDIEVTNNRIDQFSVIGIAREAVAILKNNGYKAILNFSVQAFPDTKNPTVNVKIKDPKQLLKRIMSVAMDNVLVKPSPDYIQDRLNKAGIRPLNNLIDITNYVMLELGQPTHVFDLDKIKTNLLNVRFAKPNEQIETLDGKAYRLGSNDVVIDDGTGRIIDLPGIIGAKNSMVDTKTKRILFLTQINNPLTIRKTSMAYGIRTLAATYNENNPDGITAINALYRAIELFQKIGKGRVASQIYDINTLSKLKKQISIKPKDICQYINTQINDTQIIGILRDLGFDLVKPKNETLTFDVPSYRQKDINIKEDLIEEVARIFGYHNIPSVLPPFAYISDPYLRQFNKVVETENITKRFLTNIGFFEMYNYSMISHKTNDLFNFEKSIAMINPMSQDLVCFRQALAPSLVINAQQNNLEKDLSIFELANIYVPQKNSLPDERLTLGLIIKGNYFKLKGILEALFKLGHISSVVYKNSTDKSFLDKNQAVSLHLGQEYLGYLGVLSKNLQYQFGIKFEVSLLELDFKLFAKFFKTEIPLKTLENTTPVIEDITYRPNSQYNWDTLIGLLKKQFSQIIKIEFLNVYQDYISMRIYTNVNSGKSILPQITKYLETALKITTKRLKADKNK